MYKVWRQAYYSTNGNIRPAAIISSSEHSYADSFSKIHKVTKNGNDLYWYGLKLYLTEEDANKEIFDINEYGK